MVTTVETSTQELSLDAILPQLMSVEQRQSMAEDTVRSLVHDATKQSSALRLTTTVGSQDTSDTCQKRIGTKAQGECFQLLSKFTKK